MTRRILIYGDTNLNIIDGSSVWIVNLAKLIAQNQNNHVDILLKFPIKNNVLTSELEKYTNINLIPIKNTKMIKEDNINEIMINLDNANNYSSIIVRGKEVVTKLIQTDIKSKLIPYLTNFCQNKHEITSKEKEELLAIYDSVNHMFVQTNQMKEYFMDILNINGEKFTLLSPIVFPLPSVEKEPKTICYAGKLAKDWYIEELIEIMDMIYKKDPEIKMYFIGNKFNYDLLDYKDEITSKLQEAPNIEYIPELPNEETRKIINKCELGYAFRSKKIDNDQSLELSTKFLEYGFYEMPSILRETKMYREILGEDYPLYVESVEDACEKILSYFSNPNKKITNISKKFKDYKNETIYANIENTLGKQEAKKTRFDLKRLKKIFKQ